MKEILRLRGEWGLRDDTIEKDYLLGWLLAAIYTHPKLKDTWTFKGGTALRKCFFETYRFSEDLDFTVIQGGPQTPEELLPIFEELRDALYEWAGIEIFITLDSFIQKKNLRSNDTIQGKIAYKGPRNAPNNPKIKLDITSDEILVADPETRKIVHPYSDTLPPPQSAQCYSFAELMAEKLRALEERCRPRDLYDIVHMYRHPDLADKAPLVASILARKCKFVRIEVPILETIQQSKYREEIAQEWGNMLAHQLPKLPPFESFWKSLDDIFHWLQGTPFRRLPRAMLEKDDLDSWTPSRSMTTWRENPSVELIRFAGANRLKVDLNYAAKNGRHGWRKVEPYSLRRSSEGNILLYIVNDREELRSYRISRIRGVKISAETFVPRYEVEF